MARRVFFARALFLVVFAISAQSLALADDFGMIVGNIEKHYHAKKKKIRFLGLAGFAVRIIHPAGVKSVKFAMFEDQNFTPGERDGAFEQAVKHSLNAKWKPMVRSNSRSSGNRSYVYAHESGKDIELLTVTFSRSQAIVVQAKVNPDALAKFMDKPEILGFSLAGSFNGSSSPFDPLGGVNTAGSAGWSRGSSPGYRDSSLDSLRDPGAANPESGPRSRPTFKSGSPDHSDFDSGGAGERAAGKSTSEEGVIRLEARLVNLNVKATDRSGSSLSDLRKEDFRILEDGVEQSIFYFEPVSAPINLVLLLDLSGSTRERRKVMMETARRFIDALGAGDRVAIAAFTRDFIVVSDFTSDKKHLKNSVDKMEKIQGGTAFYDAMWATLDLLEKVQDSRKAIVVLTDGVDNSIAERGYEPTNHTFDDLLARVAEEDATIYPIYLNPEETRLAQALRDPLVTGGRRERTEARLKPNLVAHHQIDLLAQESAGTVFVAEAESDLDGVYQRVAAELRLMYTLAYDPKNTKRDGGYRKINVAVKREGAVVKTRRGYFAK